VLKSAICDIPASSLMPGEYPVVISSQNFVMVLWYGDNIVATGVAVTVIIRDIYRPQNWHKIHEMH